MLVISEDCGGAILVTLNTTRFDATNAWAVREELREILCDEHDIYLFDLSQVGFIDSSGIGTLVGFAKYAGRSRRVELCGLTQPVTKVFRLTNLLSFFTIHSDAEEGLMAHRSLHRVVNE